MESLLRHGSAELIYVILFPGITLSGGQKARVNIARALYAPHKDLYLLDDPLAAVDVHVGKKIFENALMKHLQGKARILVLSSNYHLLPHCDKIVVVDAGEVNVCSSYDELKMRYPQYASRDGEDTQQRYQCELHNGSQDEIVLEDGGREGDEGDTGRGQLTPEPSVGPGLDNSLGRVNEQDTDINTSTIPSLNKSFSVYGRNRAGIMDKQRSGKILTSVEDRLKGGVALTSYWQYFASSVDAEYIWDGYITVMVVIVLFTIGQTTRVFSDMWIGLWASNQDKSDPDYSDTFFLQWYVLLVVVSALFVFGRAQYFVLSCLRASQNLHDTLLSGLLMAPVNTYFDVTPVGRILNRFSKDLDMMDSLLPDFFLQVHTRYFNVLADNHSTLDDDQV